MKTKIVLASVVAALSGLTGLATTAKAGTDVSIHLNVGLPRGVVVVPPHRGHGPDYRDHRDHSPRGYWKEIVVKTWVAPRWVVTHGRRGRDNRTLVPGHYVYSTDRVWVAYGPNHGPGNSPGYGYGYGPGRG
jgi:hypothetical protein